MSIRNPIKYFTHIRKILYSNRNSVYEYLSNRKVMTVLTFGPALVLLSLVLFVPIFWAIFGSLFDVAAFSPDWTWVGLDNYRKILTDGDFWASLQKSLVFTIGSLALQVTIGVGIALLLNRSLRGARFVRASIMLPYLISTAAVGYVFLWLGNSQYGIINQFLMNIGLIESGIAWFGNPDLAMFSVIIANSWKFTFFVTIVVLARVQAIPDTFFESAKIAGANKLQRFLHVTLPQLKGVLFIVILLRGIWMFNKFDIIWILTRGGPLGATETAPIYIYRTAFHEFNLGEAMAISVILFVLLSLAATFYFIKFEPTKEVRIE